MWIEGYSAMQIVFSRNKRGYLIIMGCQLENWYKWWMAEIGMDGVRKPKKLLLLACLDNDEWELHNFERNIKGPLSNRYFSSILKHSVPFLP